MGFVPWFCRPGVVVLSECVYYVEWQNSVKKVSVATSKLLQGFTCY